MKALVQVHLGYSGLINIAKESLSSKVLKVTGYYKKLINAVLVKSLMAMVEILEYTSQLKSGIKRNNIKGQEVFNTGTCIIHQHTAIQFIKGQPVNLLHMDVFHLMNLVLNGFSTMSLSILGLLYINNYFLICWGGH